MEFGLLPIWDCYGGAPPPWFTIAVFIIFIYKLARQWGPPEPWIMLNLGLSPQPRIIGILTARMLRIDNYLCAYCKSQTSKIEMQCDNCLAPHHRACYKLHRGCAVYGCGGAVTILSY